jgi:hypothetical protein
MLAEVLHVQQPSIAKLEHRTDMYLSTLRSHIEAMGGVLDIVARFPDGDVRIANFSDIADPPPSEEAAVITVRPSSSLPVYHGKGGLTAGLTGLSNKAMLDAADQ